MQKDPERNLNGKRRDVKSCFFFSLTKAFRDKVMGKYKVIKQRCRRAGQAGFVSRLLAFLIHSCRMVKLVSGVVGRS